MSEFHPDKEPELVTKDVPTWFCGHCEFRLEEFDMASAHYFCACSTWRLADINEKTKWLNGKELKLVSKDRVGPVWYGWRRLSQPKPYNRDEEDYGVTLD